MVGVLDYEINLKSEHEATVSKFILFLIPFANRNIFEKSLSKESQ